MLNKELQDKVDKLIKEKFGIIYNYDFKGRVFLLGGALRSTILGEEIKDLDFIILTQGECEVANFVSANNLDYRFNMFGGYKVLYNDIEVDIFSVNDLHEATQYNIDGLFYDIKNRIFISCGIFDAFKTRSISEVKNISHMGNFIFNRKRLSKLIRYIKVVTNSSKKVVIKNTNIKIVLSKIKWKLSKFKRKFKRIKNSFKSGNFRRCFRFLDGGKKEFGVIVFLGLLLTAVSMLTPALSGNLITKILYGGYASVIFIVLTLILLKVSSIAISYYLSKLYLIIKKKMIFNMRKEICNSVLNFEMGNFGDNNSGAFINKLKDDPNQITRTFNSIKNVLIGGVGNLGVLFYIFYLNFGIGLIFLIFMIIIFKIKMISVRKKIRARKAYLKEQEKYASLLGEMISGMRDIKSLDLKENYAAKTTESVEAALESEYVGAHTQNLYNKIASLIKLIAVGVVILYGIILVKNNLLDASTLIIIYMYKSSVFAFLDKITALMYLRADFNLSCNRLFSLLDDNKFSKETYGIKEKKTCSGILEFKNVDFSYEKNPVLKNCSFKINKGETVALVGESGSGKTTILSLISKIYKTNQGTVLIDGIDINELSESYIRNNISVISQNPYLFDMSIKDNLKLVDENITDEQMVKICKKVCIHDFINSLPDKYDTIIGEGGLKLSGGQKQRLGIARALIKNTKIILLDEITSALDNNTGSVIKKVIKNIQKNHTIIIVTHELSMIEDCERIFVLDEGKIIAEGSHDELIKKNKAYKKLYKLK